MQFDDLWIILYPDQKIQRYWERKLNDKTDSLSEIFASVFVTSYVSSYLKKVRKTQTHCIMSLIITICDRNLNTFVIITLFWSDAKMSWSLFCFFLIWNLINSRHPTRRVVQLPNELPNWITEHAIFSAKFNNSMLSKFSIWKSYYFILRMAFTTHYYKPIMKFPKSRFGFCFLTNFGSLSSSLTIFGSHDVIRKSNAQNVKHSNNAHIRIICISNWSLSLPQSKTKWYRMF